MENRNVRGMIVAFILVLVVVFCPAFIRTTKIERSESQVENSSSNRDSLNWSLRQISRVTVKNLASPPAYRPNEIRFGRQADGFLSQTKFQRLEFQLVHLLHCAKFGAEPGKREG